jgi:lipopolysaccharide export system permease protein
MKIIDRYLLRQFIQTFLICFLSLTGLFIVLDALTHIDGFLKCAEKHGSLASLMGEYYAYRSLLFFDLTAGILALISAMFTITWIQRHNEMTALMAAGVPRIRVALPVIVAAATVAVLTTANRELVLPRVREELVRSPDDLVGEAARKMDPRYDAQTDVGIYGEATVAKDCLIKKPSFQLPPSLDHYGSQLVAATATYLPPEGDRPGGYLLKGVSQPKDLATKPSLSLGGEPVIITPRDAPDWLGEKECFVVSNVTFDLLTEGLAYASTAQLIAGLRNPGVDFGADVRVEIHSRIVHPFLDVTLLFLGLPLVLTRENRNVFLAIGLCLLVVTVFVLATIALQHLGTTLLIPPHLAAWAPLLIFVPLAVGMAGSMWK